MHMLALVILPEGGEDDPVKWVEALMEPGRERDGEADDEFYGWWDWYRIGGRWDGTVQGVDRYKDCPGCKAGHDCHYSNEHAQVVHNLVKVRDLSELSFYRVVRPDGSTLAEKDYSRDDQDHLPFEDRDYTVHEFPEFAGRALVQYRDHYAVGVDYHS